MFLLNLVSKQNIRNPKMSKKLNENKFVSGQEPRTFLNELVKVVQSMVQSYANKPYLLSLLLV